MSLSLLALFGNILHDFHHNLHLHHDKPVFVAPALVQQALEFLQLAVMTFLALLKYLHLKEHLLNKLVEPV